MRRPREQKNAVQWLASEKMVIWGNHQGIRFMFIQLEPITGSFTRLWPERRMVPSLLDPAGFQHCWVRGAHREAPLRDLEMTQSQRPCAIPHARRMHGEAVHAGTSIYLGSFR